MGIGPLYIFIFVLLNRDEAVVFSTPGELTESLVKLAYRVVTLSR
jgi:hypothetical protein